MAQHQPAGFLPARQGIPYPDPLRRQMRENAFYFEKLRNEGRGPTDAERQAHEGSIVLPKAGEFPGLRAHNKSWKHRSYWFGPNPLGVGFEKNKYDAKAARIRLAKTLSNDRTTLVKTLGWGGNGIACLLRREHETPDGPQPEHLVVKCNMNNSPAAAANLRKEKKMQAKFHGALHVTQLKHPEIAENLPPNHPINDMLFLEYAGRGSLDKIFCSLNDAHRNPATLPAPAPEVIPNRILWLMFQCLAQSCVGMEHRPTKDWEFRHRIDANGKFDGKQPFSERVPPDPPAVPLAPGVHRDDDDDNDDEDWDDEGPTKRGTGFVHFDIDPQNVLVCESNVGPDFDCHKHFPGLKVSDFGLGVRINARDVLSNRALMAAYRKRAKTTFMTPEQFSEEWDWVTECPIYTEPPPLTAGKYSWKTNLYQFALVMFTAITLYNPHLPPLPEEMDAEDPDTGVMVKAWTYGGALFHPTFDNICLELRTLVARCLCDQPRFRPSLVRLQRTIRDHINNQVWEGADSDEAVAEWLRAKVDEAPPLRGARVGKHWVDEPPTPVPAVPLFPGLIPQPIQVQLPVLDSNLMAGIQANLLADAQANPLPNLPLAMQPGFNPIQLLNLPPGALQGLDVGGQWAQPVFPPVAQPAPIADMFPVFPPVDQQPPLFPGLQPEVPQPPLFPGWQPEVPQPPLFPGWQPAVPQPPLFPGLQPEVPQPPLFPGWQPKDPQPPQFRVVPPWRQAGLVQDSEPPPAQGQASGAMEGVEVDGVEQAAPQPPPGPALPSGPMQSVEQAAPQPPPAPAVPSGPMESVEQAAPQPPQPLNPVAPSWPPPPPQPLNPGAQPWFQAAPAPAPAEAAAPAAQPFNPLAQPWAYAGASTPEVGVTPPPPWAAKKARVVKRVKRAKKMRRVKKVRA